VDPPLPAALKQNITVLPSSINSSINITTQFPQRRDDYKREAAENPFPLLSSQGSRPLTFYLALGLNTALHYLPYLIFIHCQATRSAYQLAG
jgi:hypothetical protein